MDHAFLASIMRSPVVPPLDPWFAGGTMDVYYYLGYWIFGCLGIVSGVPSSVAFNLSLPTVLGVAAVTVYAIGTLLLDRFRWLPLLIFFIPNPSFFYQIIMGKGLNSVLWDSTRTITNTINEYPLFSFTWGDLHAHVISIFNQVFLIFLLLYLCKYWESLKSREKWIMCGLAALSLGSMPLINTWDVLIYAPITIVIATLIILGCRKRGQNISSWGHLIAIPPVSILIYLPFYLTLQTSTGGIGNRKDAIRSLPVPARKRLVHCHLSAPSHQRHTEATVSFAHRCAIHPCRLYCCCNCCHPPHLFHCKKGALHPRSSCYIRAFNSHTRGIVLPQGQYGGHLFPDEHGL